MKPVIQAKGLVKSYSIGKKKLEVLKDVSIDLSPGMTVVLGPSGAGKTTLLNLLSGLDQPTSGSVQIDGRSLSEMKHSTRQRFINQRIGFVFQFYHLVDELTALENVMLPSPLHD